MNHLKSAAKMFLLITVLTGVIYPLMITLVAQLLMSDHANGSLARKKEQIVGSFLLAQKTVGDNYFWPRPSAIDYDPIKPSGGSNLGPTSKKLKEFVEEQKKKVGADAPTDLLYASASGLDPHISLDAALYQIPRIAKARSLPEDKLLKLVNTLKEKRRLSLLGPYYVNVLRLNQALDDGR